MWAFFSYLSKSRNSFISNYLFATLVSLMEIKEDLKTSQYGMQVVRWHENNFYFRHNPIPSCCRSRWWGQSLSYPFCSTALSPSYPLGIMGVSVHPPHQLLALASCDPCQASPTTETQSRAPSPRICKLMANSIAVTFDEPQWAGIPFPSSFLRWKTLWGSFSTVNTF